MTALTYASASSFQRIQMLEEALEKVLDRGPEMSVEPFLAGDPMHVFVIQKPYSEDRTAYSLHQIARELEALLP